MANVHFLLRRLEEKKTPLIVFSFLILYSLLFYFCQRTGKWVGGSRVEKDVLTPYKFAAIVCFLFCRRLCVERGLKCLISPRNSIPTLEDDIINPHTRLNPLGLFGVMGVCSCVKRLPKYVVTLDTDTCRPRLAERGCCYRKKKAEKNKNKQ